LQLLQDIGNEICEGCGPDTDCGEYPECLRIETAIGMLDEYIKQIQACPLHVFTDMGDKLVCENCGKTILRK